MSALKVISISLVGSQIVRELGLSDSLTEFTDPSFAGMEHLVSSQIPHLILVDENDGIKDRLIAIPIQFDIIPVKAASFNELFNSVRLISEKLEIASEGALLLEVLADRLALIRHKLKYKHNLPLLCIITPNQLSEVVLTYFQELAEIVGLQLVLANSWDDVIHANPDILIKSSPDQQLAQSLKDMDQVLAFPELPELKAIKNKQFYICDGSQYLFHPGLNLVESAEILAEIVHPKQFIFGFEGKGWMRFDV
jgi:iron complex transport system substrate-binding protein